MSIAEKQMFLAENGFTVLYDRITTIDPKPFGPGLYYVTYLADGELEQAFVEQHTYDELLKEHPEIILKQLNTAADAHE